MALGVQTFIKTARGPKKWPTLALDHFKCFLRVKSFFLWQLVNASKSTFFLIQIAAQCKLESAIKFRELSLVAVVTLVNY